MLANCVNGSTAANTLAGKYIYIAPNTYEQELIYRDYQTFIFSNYRFDDNMLKNVDFDIKNYSSKNVAKLLKPFYENDVLKPILNKDFKYCPKCLEKGFHAIFHQFLFIDKCLIHNIDLINTCPNCNKKMSYGIFFTSYSTPFCCHHCNKPIKTIEFERIIGEWLEKKQSHFQITTFKNHEKIYPVLLSIHQDNDYIKSKKILNVINNIFMGNYISNMSEVKFNSHVNNWYNLKLNNYIQKFINKEDDKNIIKSYFIALNLVSRHIRKSRRLKRKNIYSTEMGVNLNNAYIIKGLDYVCRIVKGTFNYNSYVFYLWKRSVEYQKNYYFYSVNAANFSKYYFEPNYVIKDELVKLEIKLKKIIDNIILNILIRVASSLLIEKYYLWEKHVKNMMNEMSELELMLSLGYESLNRNEILSKDILILIDNKSNCNMLID